MTKNINLFFTSLKNRSQPQGAGWDVVPWTMAPSQLRVAPQAPLAVKA